MFASDKDVQIILAYSLNKREILAQSQNKHVWSVGSLILHSFTDRLYSQNWQTIHALAASQIRTLHA